MSHSGILSGGIFVRGYFVRDLVRVASAFCLSFSVLAKMVCAVFLIYRRDTMF